MIFRMSDICGETDFLKSIIVEENQHIDEPPGSITFYNWQGEPLASSFGKMEESQWKNSSQSGLYGPCDALWRF